MLATDLRHDLVRTVLMPLEGTNAAWAEARYEEMRREIAAILPGTGAPVMHRAVDLRYLGQEHTVTIALETLADWTQLRARFDAADTLSIESHGCLVIDVHAAGAMGGVGGSEHRSP